MKITLVDLVFRVLFWLLRKQKYPVLSVSQKLNGAGFVVVPMEQWLGSRSLKIPVKTMTPSQTGISIEGSCGSCFNYNEP